MEIIFKYRTLFTLPKLVDDFQPFAFHASERTVTKHKGPRKIYSACRKISDIGDSLNQTDGDGASPDDPVACDFDPITSLPTNLNHKGETRWIE